MAVEILERDLGVPVRNCMAATSRTTSTSVVSSSDQAWPNTTISTTWSTSRAALTRGPCAIDFHAWLVCRQWCHAGLPDCPACAIQPVCPKEVSRASAVRGA